jgi:hypothetical protein
MKEFRGGVTMKVSPQETYESEELAVLDAEEYLNGDVASEVFARYGVSLRVHVLKEKGAN